MSKKKNKFGWYAIIFLSLVPVLLWFRSPEPLALRFRNVGTVLTSLGQLAGLVGMIFYALTLVLNTRIRYFEDYFGGMNKVYVAHHLFGGVAFILLLLHPVFLVTGRIPISISYAAQLLLPSSDWAVNFGLSGLLFMMALLILTFYVNLPYELWKFTHKFLGAAFFLGGIHAFFIPSDISRNLILRTYMLTFVGFGLAAYVFRTLLARILVVTYPYTVHAVRLLTDNVIEVELIPNTLRRIIFHPGQFLFVRFGRPFGQESHPFSISSSPHENLKLTAKALGDFTQSLKRLKSGTHASIEGPFGRFSFDFYPSRIQIWVAGGIGITPFVSMARSLPPETQVTLYYTVRTPDEAVYLDELNALSLRQKSFRVVSVYTAESGRLTAAQIAQDCDLKSADIFLCGPPPMMHSLKQQLIKLGIPQRRLHSEEFQML